MTTFSYPFFSYLQIGKVPYNSNTLFLLFIFSILCYTAYFIQDCTSILAVEILLLIIEKKKVCAYRTSIQILFNVFSVKANSCGNIHNLVIKIGVIMRHTNGSVRSQGLTCDM